MPTDFESFDFDATGEAGSGGFLGMALLALAVGAGTALLFAPADGAKTREFVSGGLRELRGGAETALQRVGLPATEKPESSRSLQACRHPLKRPRSPGDL